MTGSHPDRTGCASWACFDYHAYGTRKNMALVPWLSVALLTMVLWWPGGWPVPVLPDLLAMLVVVATMLGGRRMAWLLLPIVCGLLQAERHLEARWPADAPARDLIVRGQVCNFPATGERARRFRLDLDDSAFSGGGPRRLQLAWYEAGIAPRAGETWELLVRIRAPRGLASPGTWDAERAALVTGTGGRGYVRKSVLNRRLSTSGWRCPSILLRRWVASRVSQVLDNHPAAAHVLAITVGVRQGLGTRDWDLLRATGTAHLMAISGLHIGLLAGAALLVGRVLAWLLVGAGGRMSPRAISLGLSLLAASAYAALAGFALPTQRAWLMLATWIFLGGSGRSVTPWTTLAIALACVTIANGVAVLTAGFWLSFGAVAALLTATLALGPAAVGTGVRRRILGLCSAQWRVFIGLAPVAALSFGELAPVSPLANFVAVPLFGIVILPLVMLGLILAVCGLTELPLRWAADLLALLLDGLAATGAETWPVPSTPAWYLPVIVLATVVLLWPRPAPGRSLAVCLLILCPFLAPGPPASGSVTVQVLDVGQGLAVVIRTHGHVLLYDTGPAFGDNDAGRTVVAPALRHAGINSVDTIVLSHADLDHAGGAGSLHAAYPRAAILAPVPDAVAVPAESCSRGQGWHWDGVDFRFLHPEPGTRLDGRNDSSCVLLVQAAGGSMLLPGDISRRVERAVAPQLPPGGVDLLIAPHHGSATSSSPALVRASSPRYVVFSAGYRNRWGFPRPDVAARWQRAGACLLETAREGAMRFAIDTAGLRLEDSHRRASVRAWNPPVGPRPCEPGDATL